MTAKQHTPWWFLPVLFLAGSALGAVIARVSLADGRAPIAIPYATAGLIAVCIVVTGWRGWQVRRMARGQKAHTSPLAAARTLVLAGASSRAGAVLAGAFGALALVYSHEGNAEYVLHQVYAALTCCGAALLLTGCGVLVEYWCRINGGSPDGSAASAVHPEVG